MLHNKTPTKAHSAKPTTRGKKVKTPHRAQKRHFAAHKDHGPAVLKMNMGQSDSSRFTNRKMPKLVIPEDYQQQAEQAQAVRDAEALKKQQRQEQTFFQTNTQPGDYTIYKSKLAFIPKASAATLLFVGFSNAMMFEEWANHKLFDMPEYFWYATGVACLGALAWGHNIISTRWVKQITAKVNQVNQLPKTISVTTGNILGMDNTKEVPLQAFRGLNASEAITVDNMSKSMISIDVTTPQKYLLLWRTGAHFANPAGALQKVLGLSKDKVEDIFVTSKGHTFNGKLYSDGDYQIVVENILRQQQEQAQATASAPPDGVPLTELQAQLDKLNGDALDYEKARALGIFKDEQEQSLLTRANAMFDQAHALLKKKNTADGIGDKELSQKLHDEIQQLSKEAADTMGMVVKSMKHKNEFLVNPIVDFNGFRKEQAVQLFKDVIASQQTNRHPLTSQLKFVFGPDCDQKGSPSNQLKALTTMYLSNHTNIKHAWGKPGTNEFGVLTIQFKQKEQFDPKLLQEGLAQHKEVKM